jgi:nucleolar protein 6
MSGSAGGGGNTKDRKSKIEAKNQKLNGERIRRLQEEERARSVKNEAAPDENAIHPSRRARVWNA